LTSITLAVPTFNQAALLDLFLQRYLKWGAELVPLIIIDDGSSDNTKFILDKISSSANFKFISIAHGGAAKARNEAIKVCDTDWIAFSDTDCEMDKEYFQTLVRIPLIYPSAMAIEGAVIPPRGARPPLVHWLENENGGAYATANFIIRVQVIRSLGGFDESFPSNLREDTDLGLSLSKLHGKPIFHPMLRIHHPFIPRPFWKSFYGAWNRQKNTLQAELRLYIKHPESYATVRRLPSAQATILWWQRRHTAFYFRESWPWLCTQLTGGVSTSLQGLFVFTAAMILATWEQICINILCLLGYNKRHTP
jgi:glycosyltransferase involved in cell wall biosynthesis